MRRPVAFKADGSLDPSRCVHIVCVGKKGSGKSVMARVIFDSWPGDQLVVDVNGDMHPGEHWELLHEVPARWPEHLRRDDRAMTLRYVPDAASKTFQEDMDAAVGLAYLHQGTLLWVDEAGVLAPSNQVPPHTRRALHQGRHRRLSSLWCAPRPLTMDPLVVAQADLVYVFELPNPADRRRIADTIGWDPEDFDAATAELGQHEYLRYDGLAERPAAGEPDRRLLHFPALPRDVARVG